MDGENHGKPYEQMDDLGVPLFLETPILSSNCAEFKWLSNIHSYDQRCIGRSRKSPPLHPCNFELRLCGSDDKRRGARKKTPGWFEV